MTPATNGNTEHRDASATSNRLRGANLRPTRQRVALAQLLFAHGDRHVTAESLFEEAKIAGAEISLATVYNTLHQFADAGLLRTIAIDSSQTYFDTNMGDHQHFYIESCGTLIDLPGNVVRVENLPKPPDGTQIAQVDIIIRVRPDNG